MDAPSTQPITMDTPLGNALTLRSMRGFEGMSQLFVFEVEAISPRSDVDPDALLGRPVTIHLQLADADEGVRDWNGVVSEFEYVKTGDDGLSRYRFTLRPWLWQLGLAADCRVFQNMSVPDIAGQIFRDRGFTDFERTLFKSYPTREYVVQYRETDLHFICRLFEQVGIYFYFRHADGKHTLVLADSPSAHTSTSGYDRLPFAAEDEQRDETMQYVCRWRADARVETGAYAVADFDFTKPAVRLYSLMRSSDDDANENLELYEYPAGFESFPAGDARARQRLEQTRRDSRGYVGESNARGLTVGSTFQLIDHPRNDQNALYLVTSARLTLRRSDLRSGDTEEEGPFRCRFGAVRAERGFRAPLGGHKPTVRGPQTATVVGPSGQEIWTDQYGRIKVQFHWDRRGENNENSSCWIRVAQTWASTGFGAQFIPRVGDEVLVDFLEGDPDRPIVTGSLYNGSNATPFALPNGQTQSGWRSRSTPSGSIFGGNQIRFEDAKGAEELYFHAERAQTTSVNGNQTVTVGGSRTLSVGASATEIVAGARSIQVVGVATSVVGGDDVETITGAKRAVVGGARVESIGGASTTDVGSTMTMNVGSVLNVTVADAIRVMAGGDETRTTGGKLTARVGDVASSAYAANKTTVVGHPDQEVAAATYVYGTSTVTTSKAITIQSVTGITLQSGDTTIGITPDGVTITGKTLTWNAGKKLAVQSPNAELSLDDNVTAVGKQVSLSSSGAQLALDSNAALTGAQVKLGSGSGSSASASDSPQSSKKDTKPVYVRTKILRNGTPASGVSYQLALNGGQTLSGSTTGQGMIEQQVPPSVTSAVLTLQDTGETRTLVFGAIDPPTTVTGAQLRLQRLGFYHGAIDGELGELMQHALLLFQNAQGLSVTGQLDSATQSALKAAYGS